MPLLLFLGLLFGGLGGFGYLGRLYVRFGGTVDRGGSVYTIAWPVFMRAAPWLIAIGVPCLLAALVWWAIS